MNTVTELQLGDAFCAYLTRRHYENFLVSSFLAPPAVRPHLRRIYAYCRLTDDLGDESGAPAARRLALWREDLERCFGGDTPPLHPALAALAETIRACRLPREPFVDLIAANLQDQRVTEYHTWEELRGYCRLSAAPVGRLVLRVSGIASPPLDALSDDVCIGLQLANFAQDVGVDREKGRCYLLQPELAERGVAGAVAALCARAADLLASGRRLEAAVDGRLRLQLALYRLGGEAILRAIAAGDYHTDQRRPHVSLPVKLRLLATARRQTLGRSSHADDLRTA
ncbi:MAG TPA: squalene/phytoene synthase family protein [Thermomicrobiales bacterium]|nr:squalene/phytoene synthase family protein [Thermomicrobiales bacterium]